MGGTFLRNGELLPGDAAGECQLAGLTASTVRTTVEQTLASAERRLRALVECSEDGIALIDRRGRIRYGSPAVGRMLGFAGEDAVGLRVLGLVHPHDRSAVATAAAAAAARPGTTTEVRARMRCKTGEYRQLTGTLRDLFDASDVQALVVNIRNPNDWHDIESGYRALIERSADAHFIMVDQRIVYANPAGARLYAASSADVLAGMAPEDLLAPDDRPAARARMAAVLRGDPTPPRTEAKHLRLDGVSIDVEITSAPFLYRGRRAIQAVIRDISDRKRAERLLRVEHTVTRSLAHAETVGKAISDVIRAVCESENWECGRYFRIDAEADLLRLCETWNIPDSPLNVFIERTRDLTYRRGAGLVGRVWESGEPLWVADITTDPRALRQVFRDEPGIRGAFVFPVKFDGNTIGVFAFNSREVRVPDERLLQAVGVIGSQIGQFLQRKQAEDVRRESEERLRALMELSSDWYWEQDEELRFVRTPHKPSHLGADLVQSGGKRRWELPNARPITGTWDEHRATLQSHLPFRDFEYLRVDSTGHGRYTSVTGVPIFDRDGTFRGYRGVAKDITQRKLAEERLLQLAQFDALTGLPNRTLLRDRLDQTLAQARRKDWLVGVLFVDLDRFKLVNDTLGHEKGDALLTQVAARLKACVRPEDTIGRISGDEFAVVLADVAHADHVSLIAQRMIERLGEPFDLDGHEAFVGASIGISIYPSDAADSDSLLKFADVAMYRAKEFGRNGYCYYTAEMNQRTAAKLALNNDLRRALARGELEVHYQPKVCLRRGGTHGLEALLRWRHPERGLVMPGEFIPALEETGLIVAAGDWVVRAVCEQVKAWQGAGLTAVPVAVNLSVRQFQQKDLDASIRGIVAAAGIDPAMIELEITESQLMRNPEHAIRTMRNLRDAGISISVDDFGTGYSSLAYLRHLPISSLKIDRSFVRNVHEDESDATIVRAIIDLAHNLNFTVVAEGVETEAQAALLRRHGCELAQGYFFGRPVPPDQAAERLVHRDATA